MGVTCIDLKKRFGTKFKVVKEGSYEAEYGETAIRHDPWLLILPCQNGHIYPYGEERLGASTNTTGPIASKLKSLNCTRVEQDGSDGVNVSFHVSDFTVVAEVMKPRKRRRLTEEQRRQAIERLERVRPKKFRPKPTSSDAP